MPYKDLKRQRAYQREWMARQRREYLATAGGCVECGATENLHVDHIDRETKVSHRIWSWRKELRDAELAKCQILCAICHRAKTGEENRQANYRRYSKITLSSA
jgi:5-methylcytosine-specific restriction endonuclease McrA